jgi:hypothetical protein
MNRPPVLTFDVNPDERGGWIARCREADIAAQSDTFESISDKAHEAVRRYYSDQPTGGEIKFVFH